MESAPAGPARDSSGASVNGDRILRFAWYLVADLRAEADALVHLEPGVLLRALDKVARELSVSLRATGSLERIESHLARKLGDAGPNTLWLSWMNVSAAHRISTLVREVERSLGVAEQ